MMALGESQDRSWVASGWEAMSFFVCFLYAIKAAVNIVSKSVEEAEVDIFPAEGVWSDTGRGKIQ